MKKLLVLTTLGLALGLSSSAVAAPKARKPAPSKSLGSPDQGQLVGGKQLVPGKTVRAVGSLRWGLPQLVDMLTRSAEHVAKKHPGSVLTVGDLSKKGGGEVGGHRSHESGRDADVAFYLVRKDKTFVAPRFAKIDEEGRAIGFPGAMFDDARNWDLVESWLKDPEANVLQIFVAAHLKRRLLAQAVRSGASQSMLTRAQGALIQPTKALPHDNHFHVRIACPSGQGDCVNFGKKALLASRSGKATKNHGTRPVAKLARAHTSTRVKDMSSSRR